MTAVAKTELELMHDELMIRKALQECMKERLLNNQKIMDSLKEALK